MAGTPTGKPSSLQVAGVEMALTEWRGYVLEQYRFEFGPGSRVLDLGCGEGEELSKLGEQALWACGIDPSGAAMARCGVSGLRVVRARGERLPFVRESFDGVICKVVVPYTDERATIRSIGDVLRPGGIAYVVSHGAGYYLRYVLRPPSWKHQVYGLRAMINTWLWSLTGRLLPGFLGDTLYQSRARLLRWYEAAGLVLDREFPSRRYLGRPVFLYDRVRKAD
jgi:SAM-dependent methyltransferase